MMFKAEAIILYTEAPDTKEHIFTSCDIRGLFVSSFNIEKAFNDIPLVIINLFHLNHRLLVGVECKWGLAYLNDLRKYANTKSYPIDIPYEISYEKRT